MKRRMNRKGFFNDVDKKSVTIGDSSGETTQKTTQKTTPKVLHNIRMNNLHANCIQIARKKYNLPMIVRGYRETEPQMNADERRFIERDFQQYSKDGKPQSLDSKLPAFKHENETLNSTRMTQIKRIYTDPRKSAPSAKSAFYRRTDPRTKSTGGKVSVFICVHPRFFYDVTFQYCDSLRRESMLINNGFSLEGVCL